MAGIAREAKNKPLIGILGGVGPGATALLSTLLVDRTEADYDQAHINTLVFNDASLPDRTAFILGESDVSPLDPLVHHAQLLERCGCTHLALPCNTAHKWHEQIQAAVSIPLINMIELTADACQRQGLTRVGVAATRGTLHTQVYHAALKTRGIEPISPDEAGAAVISALIYDKVKAGIQTTQTDLDEVYRAFMDVGEGESCGASCDAEESAAVGDHPACDGVILGCTELSLAFDQHRAAPHGLTVIDSLSELVTGIQQATGVTARS